MCSALMPQEDGTEYFFSHNAIAHVLTLRVIFTGFAGLRSLLTEIGQLSNLQELYLGK